MVSKETTMPRVATIDARQQSYNVEMAEVIGGNFWKPYGALGPAYMRTSRTWANMVYFDDAASRDPYSGWTCARGTGHHRVPGGRGRGELRLPLAVRAARESHGHA